MLLVCPWHSPSMHPACIRRAPGSLPACFWYAVGVHPACCRHASGMHLACCWLLECSWHASGTLLMCFWRADCSFLACFLCSLCTLLACSLHASGVLLCPVPHETVTEVWIRSGSGLDRKVILAGAIYKKPLWAQKTRNGCRHSSFLASSWVSKARLQPRLCCATLLHLAQPCPELGGPFWHELYQIVRQCQCQCLGSLHLELQR